MMTKIEKEAAGLLARRAELAKKLDEFTAKIVELDGRREAALHDLGGALAGLGGDVGAARKLLSKIEGELTEARAAKSALEGELAKLLPELEAAAGELAEATAVHRRRALERLQLEFTAAAELFAVAERRVAAGLQALGLEAPSTLELSGPSGSVELDLDWRGDDKAEKLHAELAAPLRAAVNVDRVLAEERGRVAWRRGELGRRGRGRASFDDVADHPWWVVREMQVSLNDGTILKPGERFHREQVQGPRRLRLLYESRRAAPFYEDGEPGEAA